MQIKLGNQFKNGSIFPTFDPKYLRKSEVGTLSGDDDSKIETAQSKDTEVQTIIMHVKPWELASSIPS